MSQDPNMSGRSEGKPDNSEDNQQDSLENPEQSVRKKVRQNTPSPTRGNTPEASPPQFVSVEELMETAKGVTNMVLAHEIVVNGGFQIKPADLPENSLEKRVRDIVHKAFWDCLETQLKEDPPSYDHAIKLVGEIKETLLSFLLPGHTRLRNQITDALDLELIKQEAENGALDIAKLAEFIIGMMGTLCAPARDEEIKKLKDIHEIVPMFRAIFSVLDLMKMDMANFAVSSIRPHLMQQSVEYERKKFQELYEKQPNSLDFVTEWLQEAADDLRSKVTPAIDDGTASASRAAALCPIAVQNHAYLKLLKWDHLRKPFPETVLMDQSRFQEMQLELDQLVLTGAILLVTFNAAGTALSGLPGFTGKLKMVIQVLLTGLHLPSFNLNEALAVLSEKIGAEVNSCLSQHGFTPFTPEKEAVLKGQIQAVANPDNTVCKLIDSRIQSFLESFLAAGHQKSLPAIPGGLGPVQRELEEIAVKYVRLVNYNKMVFGPYYDDILSKILNIKELPPL
ncbi:T-complex protein 11-like protein 1 isoform X1 [Varanus komodoensis]|uniref:T-complex 11 like 1 n=2 Tax=Varanus komodoensis TaxID=61221 RepID=A0A8D2IQN0_VARKO|nr:T-complex protein 11-like protein 1 isoform X1 [Varanus komodoensis]XP_044281876.1 T-complex protein 11-like protein 1 isoform X1 [Varanus komodoensis]XP_044281877.1 T-complex protein 11-like protein 1 isoform X1 [Varanus komodoensis]XP_044281878.1 T-complex protein 11-like protein 1 isoform X1 [Varanus komodoensis]XP_044281879.1 T-complex protein 11-like protein 1 isoform X1 [Varanus komodoensis]XP_044281880.1 T-complex protein 11-like protein 1 isoform X1 [Varanus komodoensis]